MIFAPAKLCEQWQTEMIDKLGIPCARWETQKKVWLDHDDRVISPAGREQIARCPLRIGIVSTGLMMRDSLEKPHLLGLRFALVILDEAHKARSRQGFRAVHACWNETDIQQLKALTRHGVMSEDQLIKAADRGHTLFELVETALKGPELQLPDGFFFVDKGGHERKEVRRKWWDGRAVSWRDVAISVPDPGQLPDQTLPDEILTSAYPSNAVPVFFGHYWMTGNPLLQAENALCLDYSAGLDGPLASYEAQPGRSTLSLDRLKIHG